MRTYAIIQTIITVIGVVAGIFSYSFILLISTDIMGFIIGVVAFIVIIGILSFIYFLKYLKDLNTVGQSTGDPNLQKSYRMQLWALIISVGVVLFLVFILIGLLFTMDVYAFIPLLLASFGLVAIIGIIGFILQIVGVLALGDWGQMYKMTHFQSIWAQKIAGGIDLIKWGTILQIIVGTLATILQIIGFFQTATAIKAEFENPSLPSSYAKSGPIYMTGSYAPTYSQPYPQNTYRTEIPAPHTAMTPQPRFCMYCGTALDQIGIKFCPNCGKNLL
jgi:hypothetical protein